MESKAAKKDIDLKIGKITLHLTNQDKVYWPDEGYTKGDLVNYYKEVSSFILPYLKDRPESLNRFPNGINGPSFYQKDQDTKVIPKWVKTHPVYSESNQEDLDYLICNNLPTLLYMANLGCIEINPWNSRLKKLDYPDWVVMDLDPGDIPFVEVVKTAIEVRKVLEEAKISGYCKTSGATGLHIYVPLGAKYEYPEAREFMKTIAEHVHERLPATTSMERSPAKRRKQIYLDYLQNSRGQTLAAPYCVRPKPGATVSTPLEWDEVNAKLDPKKFTIKTIFKRLEKVGDLWKPVISDRSLLG
jgi:bifunctional non-homologous end joining protein LigD